LVRRPEGKRPHRPIGRREDNIKMDLGEAGFECVDWLRIQTGGQLL
jgi:hypothetical protein